MPDGFRITRLPRANECHWPMANAGCPDWWCGLETVCGTPYCKRHVNRVVMLPALPHHAKPGRMF